MAIVGTAELLIGSAGDRDNESGQRGFTNEYQVFSDGISENRVTVLTAPGLPYPFQPHPDWSDAFAYQFDCKQDTSMRTRWIVTVTYKTFDSSDTGSDNNDPVENPLARPPRISRSSETIEIEVFKDQNGKAYVNSLGEPYVNPPIKIPYSRSVYRVEQNLSYFDADAHDAYENAINSDVFTLFRPQFAKTFAVGTAYIKSFEVTPEKENDIPFWKRITTIIHDRRGWNDAKNPLDYSFHWIWTVGGNKYKRRIYDTAGHPASQPALLDSSQIPLTEYYQVKYNGQSAGWTIDPITDPVYNQFQHFKALPFAGLNFI